MTRLFSIAFSLICLGHLANAQEVVFNEIPHYNTTANFHILDKTVYWQKTYEYKGISKDSIFALILAATRADPTLQLLNNTDNGTELLYTIVNKDVSAKLRMYKAQMTVETKDEKYRVTLNFIQMAGKDPQATLEKSGEYFHYKQLLYLADLNTAFDSSFDFRMHLPKRTAKRDW